MKKYMVGLLAIFFAVFASAFTAPDAPLPDGEEYVKVNGDYLLKVTRTGYCDYDAVEICTFILKPYGVPNGRANEFPPFADGDFDPSPVPGEGVEYKWIDTTP